MSRTEPLEWSSENLASNELPFQPNTLFYWSSVNQAFFLEKLSFQENLASTNFSCHTFSTQEPPSWGHFLKFDFLFSDFLDFLTPKPFIQMTFWHLCDWYNLLLKFSYLAHVAVMREKRKACMFILEGFGVKRRKNPPGNQVFWAQEEDAENLFTGVFYELDKHLTLGGFKFDLFVYSEITVTCIFL